MKMFSDEQVTATKRLIDLQRDVDNRIENMIQETLLRKNLSGDELKVQLKRLKESLTDVIDERL